jgi:enoyl-CoA hydratase
MNQWMLQAAPVFGESLALEMLGFLGSDAAEGLQAVRERRSPEFPSAR